MDRKRSIWIDATVLLLLCLLSLYYYRQIVLSNRILSGVDAFTYFYPYRTHAARALGAGEVPLWNPYLFLGAPFLANSQAGVFYPLNLLLNWLPAPAHVAWSIAIHTALAAAFAYLYARLSLRLSALPAALGAVAFAFGGFLSGQIEHVNQLNVSAWLPLLLLLWDLRARAQRPALLGLGLVFGAGLLAGHTQASYISFFALALYALFPVLVDLYRAVRHSTRPNRPISWRALPARAISLLRPGGAVLLQLAAVALVGAVLAAVQILPTLELARFSIRSGGLSYREAVAFSLRPLPRLLRYTFLPPWDANLADAFGGSYYTEYLAYVGVVPLLLIAAWALVWALGRTGRLAVSLHESTSPPRTLQLAGLALIGAALALGIYNPAYYVLYRLVPGFSLFRVPARWLLLYAFSVPMIAAASTQRLADWWHAHRAAQAGPGRCRWLQVAPALVVAATAVELVLASSVLPFSHPTAPEAYSLLRTAPAHILTAQQATPAPGRVLSMSDILFDPGDLAEIQQIFAGQLTAQEIYDYVVAAKRKEILAPNLPLAWQIYAVDGYDGGLLPLARYIELQRLFLDEDEILTDGRLREGLEAIPPSRLLSLLGVRYAITDKVHDVWIDDVFYDTAFEAVLDDTGRDTVSSPEVAPFLATGLGLLSYLEGAEAVADGTPVAQVELIAEDGQVIAVTLRAGEDTSEGRYTAAAAHAQARIGRTWPDQPEGADYLVRQHWETPLSIVQVRVHALTFEGRIHVRGCALVDDRDGSNVSVLLSTEGTYQNVHSGDVKIYEVLDALPRAHVVHSARIIGVDPLAREAIADPAFDPSQVVILANGQSFSHKPEALPEVRVTDYEEERITVEATLHAPGYLVLSDTWYPGWRATVDQEPATIERANIAFRAVYLPAGTHTVRFAYRPFSVYAGAAISATALLAALAYIVIAWQRRSSGT